MFKPSSAPRIFHLPLGVDFPRELVAGLLDRLKDQPPEALARVQLIVNTRRMARRVRALFDEGPARLLPQIGLLTDLGERWNLAQIPPTRCRPCAAVWNWRSWWPGCWTRSPIWPRDPRCSN